MVKQKVSCRHNWIFFVMLAIGIGFIIVGCSGVYRALGMPDETPAVAGEADEEAIRAAAAEAVAEFAAQLASGVPLPAAAAATGSKLAWQLATVLLGGAGTIISTLLAKWLGTEKKITSSLIRGIEKSGKDNVKTAVKAEATSAGVEPVLHSRVTKLTSA